MSAKSFAPCRHVRLARQYLWLCALLSALAAFGDEQLRPGDTLAISVYNHEELGLMVRVAGSGMVRVPLVGAVKASGLSADALAEDLGKSWQKAGIADAFVTVHVTEYAPRVAYVLGQVQGGGQKCDIPPAGTLTAMQAIISAGGFTENADLRRVAILRTVKDKTESLPVDVISFVNALPNSTDIALQPGDILAVPRALPVTVLGLVSSPGILQIDTAKQTLCSQLIGLAGGFQKGAVRDHVLVLRKTDGKETKRFEVDVAAALAGQPTNDIPILPGDTVIVREAEKIYVCGQVNAAGALDIDPQAPITLMRAITLCGGFTEYANQRNVILVRDNKIMEIDVRNVFLKNDKMANDLVLRAGDLVFVKESIW